MSKREYTQEEIVSGTAYLDAVTSARGALRATKIGTRQTGYAKWALDAACDLTRCQEVLREAAALHRAGLEQCKNAAEQRAYDDKVVSLLKRVEEVL